MLIIEIIDVLTEYLEQLDDECEFKNEISVVINSLEDGDLDISILNQIQQCLDNISNTTEAIEIVSDRVKLDDLEKELDCSEEKAAEFVDKLNKIAKKDLYCSGWRYTEDKKIDTIEYVEEDIKEYEVLINIRFEKEICKCPKCNEFVGRDFLNVHVLGCGTIF